MCSRNAQISYEKLNAFAANLYSPKLGNSYVTAFLVEAKVLFAAEPDRPQAKALKLPSSHLG